ncbi:MAG: IS21 family transposase [Spirochaetaceae bacterium]|nr:IS21 family transposase [Spirochaetaceae bacterium]
MEKETFNAWIMYHEIQQLDLLGFSKNRIARYLKLNWRTVNKYFNLTEEGYEQFLLQKCRKDKILDPYTDFVLTHLKEYSDTSASQMFDWLKEHHPDLPDVCEKTVYNFVMDIRQKHNIPFIDFFREYFPVEELPFGLQAQVDFGEYNMRGHGKSRKKVCFFAMVLSRSRMKYICFLDRHFTAKDVCIAHEKSFEYFEGIPQTIVYDQDRTIVVDENIGNIILTSDFRNYTKSRSFKRHFCRKADPESKGKVENVVGYVKKNFLYNRKFFDLDTLNDQAIAWLERTANKNIHNLTKKSPLDEFAIEKQHLSPYTPLTIKTDDMKKNIVRKTNVVNYRGSFYSLPQGTYTGKEVSVLIKEQDGEVQIYSTEKNFICSHKLSAEKGKTIINTDHRRDKSASINEMMQAVAESFSDTEKAINYFKKIQKDLPRYTRDHLQAISRTLKDIPQNIADKTLDFCIKNHNYDGHDFESVSFILWDTSSLKIKVPDIKPMNMNNVSKVNEKPEISDINDYQDIINT